MFKLRMLFECVAEAVYAKGLKAVARLVPFGESLYDIASEAWERINKRCAAEKELALKKSGAGDAPTPAPVSPGQVEANLKTGLEEAARLTPQEIKQEALHAVQQVGAGQPPEVQQALVSYLSQMPGVIRRSLRRPQDPTGTTMPKGLH